MVKELELGVLVPIFLAIWLSGIVALDFFWKQVFKETRKAMIAITISLSSMILWTPISSYISYYVAWILNNVVSTVL